MTLDSVLSHARMRLLRLRGKFTALDPGAYVHWTVQLSARRPHQIEVERDVRIDKSTWINIPDEVDEDRPYIHIGIGTRIGRNNVISARNGIMIGENCVTAPQVLLMDHSHEYRHIDTPVVKQGVTEGGRIILESGCWIGFGAAVLCNRGKLRIGRNAVVGCNSVVTKNVEPYTIVVGAPAAVICKYDSNLAMWKTVHRR